MNYIYKLVFAAVALFSVTNNALAAVPQLSVNIPDLSATISYQQPVRLSQLLSDTQALIQKQEKKSSFWLAAQLLQKDKNAQLNLLKNNLLKQLQRLSSESSRSALKATQLSAFIKSHHFNYRHFISLDNDLVRIVKQQDPLLKGAFTLLIPNRVNKIRIIGSSEPTLNLSLIEHAALNDYLKTINLPANSATSVVYVIQPDGTLNKINNAYWNRKLTFLAPGATLFVGFDTLPDNYSSLNEQIAELLRYMPPLTEGEKRS